MNSRRHIARSASADEELRRPRRRTLHHPSREFIRLAASARPGMVARMMRNYSRVSLVTNRFQAQGIASGAVGYVIEVYDNGDCEVEFSRLDGMTYVQIMACAGD